MYRATGFAIMVSSALTTPLRAESNVDAAHKFAWAENTGWTNWRGEAAPGQGVTVHNSFLSGFVWGENVGWINTGDGSPANGESYGNMDGSDVGVNITPDDCLTGFAWGENIGWVNLEGGASAEPANPARLDRAAGRLRGYAWGENVGWINLDDAMHFVGVITAVDITQANPPLDNPYLPGIQPFRDVLQTGATAGLTQGIGAAGTPDEGPIRYAPISVTFGALPIPSPSPSNITVSCTDVAGNGLNDCPAVTAVDEGPSPSQFLITLSAAIPPRECVTITFAGTAPGQELQYQSLPGDTSQNGTTNTVDLLAIITALNNGTANQAENLARFNVNRSARPVGVNTTDLLRQVQLLNGVNTTQVFNGAAVAACP